MNTPLTFTPLRAYKQMLLGAVFIAGAAYFNVYKPAMALTGGATHEIRAACSSTTGCDRVRFMRDMDSRLGLVLIVQFEVTRAVGAQTRQALRRIATDRSTGEKALKIDFKEVPASSPTNGGL